MKSLLTLSDGNIIEVVGVVPGAGSYQAVAASQAGAQLGATGAIGDYLGSLLVVVATATTAQVQIQDGSGTAITVFPNSPGGGVGSYTVPINARSVNGGWKVITGAGVTVLASGDFT